MGQRIITRMPDNLYQSPQSMKKTADRDPRARGSGEGQSAPRFETGFYIFSSITPDYGWQWVGDHIRPRVRAPVSWHWPVGVSLSAEFGYQRPAYSADTWTLEVRPIIDKQLGRLYCLSTPRWTDHFTVFQRRIEWNFLRTLSLATM